MVISNYMDGEGGGKGGAALNKNNIVDERTMQMRLGNCEFQSIISIFFLIGCRGMFADGHPPAVRPSIHPSIHPPASINSTTHRPAHYSPQESEWLNCSIADRYCSVGQRRHRRSPCSVPCTYQL